MTSPGGDLVWTEQAAMRGGVKVEKSFTLLSIRRKVMPLSFWSVATFQSEILEDNCRSGSVLTVALLTGGRVGAKE